MPEPTAFQTIIELADKITATVVLITIIYLFVCGKILAKGTIDIAVKKYYDRLNGVNDDDCK